MIKSRFLRFLARPRRLATVNVVPDDNYYTMITVIKHVEEAAIEDFGR